MPDHEDLELTALEYVRGVDDDLIGGESRPCTDVLERSADVVSLVAVGDADGDVSGLQAPGSVLVVNGEVSVEEFLDYVDYRLDGFGVGLRHRQVVEFEVGPPVSRRVVDRVRCPAAVQWSDATS